MTNYVARLAASYHPSFLHIFQQAAARAYVRVRRDTNHSAPSIATSFRKSVDRPWRLQSSSASSPQRFRSNLPVQRRFSRHYSSRAQAEPTPLHALLNGLHSNHNRRNVQKHPLRGQKNQRPQSSRDIPLQTKSAGETTNSAAPAPSIIPQDTSLSGLPEDHDVSRHPVAKSSISNRENWLSQRLRQLFMSSPHASIQSLMSYHSTFPDLQTSRSYNFLLWLAIRRSAFGTAHALVKSMHASRIPEDQTTWQLCVRLLVREGRWPDAYSLVMNLPRNRPRAPFVSDGIPVVVWAELFGTLKHRAFRGPQHIRDPGMHTPARYRHVMRQLPKLGVSPMDRPPSQVVYASVAALLRMQEREAAQQVTTQFLSVDPKGLGLRLVHLHVAAEPGRHSLATFYHALRDLQGFRVVCPALEPNSTTLFLLLGHLKRAKQCGIIGHKLVRGFCRRWGNSVISPGVERRLLALAVKEKRVELIRRWMTCVKTRRKSGWSVEGGVVDGAVPRRPSLGWDLDLRPVCAGTERLRVDRLLRRASRVLERKRSN
ncbi:hypothetical protein BC826DRAFT_978320 [Russula brevipes]|nr:hypothetical protein BC826DRAFT_978320 [Russula brevipes]